MIPRTGSIVGWWHGNRLAIGFVAGEEKQRLRLVRARGKDERLKPERIVVVVDPETSPATEDLAESKISNLYGAALAHWNLARHHRAGSAKVHVYNPRLDEHGNSVRAIKACVELADEFGLHGFEFSNTGSSMLSVYL